MSRRLSRVRISAPPEEEGMNLAWAGAGRIVLVPVKSLNGPISGFGNFSVLFNDVTLIKKNGYLDNSSNKSGDMGNIILVPLIAIEYDGIGKMD